MSEYKKNLWINNETKLNADNRNHIEAGISSLNDSVSALPKGLSARENSVYLSPSATSVSFKTIENESIIGDGNIFYSAGEGLKKEGTTFSVDYEKVATKASVDAVDKRITDKEAQDLKNALDKFRKRNVTDDGFVPIGNIDGIGKLAKKDSLTASDVGALPSSTKLITSTDVEEAIASKNFATASQLESVTPTIGSDNKWYIGGNPTNILATGIKGDKGDKGVKGDTGSNGADGLTYIPTISSKGILTFATSGNPTQNFNVKGNDGDTYVPTISSEGILKWSKSGTPTQNFKIKGEKGDKGDQGVQGIQGIQGVKGVDGINGFTWRPSVDGKGNITWSKDASDVIPTMQNIKGTDGINGKTPIPTVDGKGNLSWSFGTSLPTASVNIKGTKGDKGDRGDRGYSGKDGMNAGYSIPLVVSFESFQIFTKFPIEFRRAYENPDYKQALLDVLNVFSNEDNMPSNKDEQIEYARRLFEYSGFITQSTNAFTGGHLSIDSVKGTVDDFIEESPYIVWTALNSTDYTKALVMSLNGEKITPVYGEDPFKISLTQEDVDEIKEIVNNL